jgi:carboxylate-amine ligase
VRHLVNHHNVNARPTPLMRAFSAENHWRAQRYGMGAMFIDEVKHAAVPFQKVLTEAVALVEEDAAELGVASEISHIDTILARGTSAHQQLWAFKRDLERGATAADAIQTVCRWLKDSTERSDFVQFDETANGHKDNPDVVIALPLSPLSAQPLQHFESFR